MYIKCDYCKISLLSEHAWKRFFSDNHSLFDLHTISLIYFTTIQCADLFFIFLFFYFWCFNATFNNISAISWRPVLVVKETGVPGENFISCDCESSAPFLAHLVKGHVSFQFCHHLVSVVRHI
jgi:hypothetical protein